MSSPPQAPPRIDGLRYIQNIGRFESFRGGPETAFAPLTLVFSENGRGKTTLCAIFRSLTTGDSGPILERKRLSATSEAKAVVDLGGEATAFDGARWGSRGPRIAIFDEHFVNTNVHSGLSVGAEHRKGVHELVVGEEGVLLQRRVEELTQQISTLQSELRQKESAIPAATRGIRSVEEFCALTRNEDLEKEIYGAERKLAVVRDAEAIRRKEGFRPFELPSVPLDDYRSLVAASLPEIEASAVAAVNEHFSDLGAGAERWTSDGLGYLAGNDRCPFCGQGVSGSTLITHYRAYFSDAYARHKQRIEETRAKIAEELGGDRLAGLQRVLQQEHDKREDWARYVEVPPFDLDHEELATAWITLRVELLAALDAKAAAPLESTVLGSDAREAARRYQALEVTVRTSSAALVDRNAAVERVKEHAAEGSTPAAEAEVECLRALQRRFEPQVDAACSEYLATKARKVEAEQEKIRARAELDQHRKRVFAQYAVAINRYLRAFDADFTVDGLRPSDKRGVPSSTYGVQINGQTVGLNPPALPGPSFQTALSAGDRNTLALGFFLAMLERLPVEDCIVVIDDPISSLDNARTSVTIEEIRKLVGRCQQLVVLSHSRALLCPIWEKADRSQTAALEIRNAGAVSSTIAPWDIESAAVTEFDRLHRLVRGYAEECHGDPQKVAPALRILLECFLRVAFVAHFPPGSTLGCFVRRVKQALAEGAPILPEEAIEELDALRDYANRFHHTTNGGWLNDLANVNEGALRGYARRVLRFTTLDGRLAMLPTAAPPGAGESSGPQGDVP